MSHGRSPLTVDKCSHVCAFFAYMPHQDVQASLVHAPPARLLLALIRGGTVIRGGTDGSWTWALNVRLIRLSHADLFRPPSTCFLFFFIFF